MRRRLFSRCIIAALATLSAQASANTSFSGQSSATEFHSSPILATGASFPPNILLALSVEFPTAGSAYQASLAAGNTPLINKNEFDANEYIGYFDPQKCYSYTGNPDIPDDENGYFTPDRQADSRGYCGGNLFSGKALNWMTMTTIDIFRQAMTGGNRAKGGTVGTSSKQSNYTDADTLNFTALRRANVVSNQNGIYGLRARYLENDALISNILPSYVVSAIDKPSKEFTIKNNSVNKNVIQINNNGFKLRIGGNGLDRNNNPIASKGKAVKTYNVVVQVCKPGLEEKNCRVYTDSRGRTSLKPTGVMQEKIEAARFGVFGYANINGNNIDGGVLRSRMKFLRGETTHNNIVLGNEVNEDGTFNVNPDQSDAQNTNVTNSGVINYLNKFGDAGKYKVQDPAGELYYAGLRYLRNKGNYRPWTDWLNTNSTLKNNEAVDENKRNVAIDGFPVITDWNDPLLSKGNVIDDKQVVCRPNYIMYIGDTFTHSDNDVPNFIYNTHAPTDDNEINTLGSLRALANQENNPFDAGTSLLGAYNLKEAAASYGSIAGLAYWARTNDIRSDVKGNQYIQSIMIDVLEYNNHHIHNGKNYNTFYWAAKYGGFRSNKAEREGAVPTLTTQDSDRIRWTNDARGTTSIGAFSDGVPRNYAAANSPQSLIEAINKAFNNVEALSDTPSQTSLAVEQTKDGIVDLTTAHSPLFLQSSYRKNDHGWQGDVIAYTMSADSRPGSPDFSKQWQLSTLLKRSSADSRRVFTLNGNSIDSLANTAQGAGAAALFGLQGNEGYTPVNLKDYVLGKSDKEKTTTNPSGVFRPRPDDGLLGTVVNSSVAILPPPVSENVGSCRYDNFSSLKTRKTVYAFAANDGMLHVIDNTGSEKLAYIPSTALPKLKEYADPQGTHSFLNDGTPVVQEVCTSGAGKTAKSVIIGTTGRGGEAVYAIDATQLGTGHSANAGNILWEFNKTHDEDLGLTVHAPVPVQVKKGSDSIAAVVVSGGYNAKNDRGHIFILQTDKSGSWIQNGNYWKIPLGKSGVGAPRAIDTDSDGNIDRIYVGDQAGKLYRIDQTAGGSWTVKTLFNGSQPITGAPDVHFSGGRYTVVFNTGQYFKPTDGTKPGLQNYAYGLFDTDGSTIAESSLVQQQIKTEQSVASVGQRTYLSATQNAANNKGWRLQLPVSYIGIDDAFVRRGRTAQFFVFSVNDNSKINTANAANICANNSGKSALIEVDLRNGGLYKKPVFDTDRDGLFNTNDTLAAMSVNENSLSLKRKNITINNGISKAYDSAISHGDSNQTADEERLNRFQNKVSRISWREIF